MVSALTAFATIFRDLGLSSSTVQSPTLTHAQLSTLYWINVAAGLLLTLAVVGLSPIVAWFYNRPELISMTAIIALNFLLGSFGTQQSALLTRQMRFGRLAVASLGSGLLALPVTIGLAACGWSQWALVWGGIFGTSMNTLLLNVLANWQPSSPSLGTGIRSMLRFGANVTAYDFVNYFHRNLDNILIGRFCGAEAIGYYSRAYTLMMVPINNLRGPISSIAFPALSRLSSQEADFRAYYRSICSLLAATSMPLTAFLYVASDRVIELLLGPQWAAVSSIFSALAIVAFIQPILTLWGIVVLSKGMGRRYFHIGVFNTASSAIGIVAGLPWGPSGVAIGYAISIYLTLYPTLKWAFKETPVKISDFFAASWRPAIASLAAAAATQFLVTPLIPNLPLLLNLTLMASAYAVAYITFTLALPGGKTELTRLLLRLRSMFRAYTRA